jgi:DNA-directed RNA polymerase II subunit RPB2
MAANHVYVFAKAQPSPISFLAEVRSAVEKGGKTISTMQVKMFHRNPQKTVGVYPFLCGASTDFC